MKKTKTRLCHYIYRCYLIKEWRRTSSRWKPQRQYNHIKKKSFIFITFIYSFLDRLEQKQNQIVLFIDRYLRIFFFFCQYVRNIYLRFITKTFLASLQWIFDNDETNNSDMKVNISLT